MAHHQQYRNIFEKEPPLGILSLKMKNEDPQYKPGENDEKIPFTTVHWETRRKFNAVLMFVSTFAKPDHHILILDDSNGSYIPKLIALFPELTWEMWFSTERPDMRLSRNDRFYRNISFNKRTEFVEIL